MTRDEHVKYWVESSAHDFEVMQDLFRNRHFVWTLFAGHLVVEKLLKAYFVKQKGSPCPYTHNLLKIAEDSGLTIDREQRAFLDEMTAFNIRARYPDYKQRFYRVATQDFTARYVEKIKDYRQWLLQQIAN